jgi:hypothetical protein
MTRCTATALMSRAFVHVTSMESLTSNQDLRCTKLPVHGELKTKTQPGPDVKTAVAFENYVRYYAFERGRFHRARLVAEVVSPS